MTIRPLYLLLLLALAACKKEKTPSRSFAMGVTPWPAAFTVSSSDSAYRFINEHCDLVSQHLDEGVPYQEAFAGLPWPQRLLDDIAYRKSKVQAGKKTLLSICPLDLTRRHKADYHIGSTLPDSTKNRWRNLPLSDPALVTAYVNYASFLIDQFQPDYINYGVESNEVNWAPAEFAAFKGFIAGVYTRLKTKYPGTPLFLSFMVNEDPRSLPYATELLPYTDYITLSAYPYIWAASTANGNTDPAGFPADLFSRYTRLANKPFGFAETGYIAQDLLLPAYNLNKKGRAEWQRAYLQKVLEFTQQQNGRFFIWFCGQDYDRLSDYFRGQGTYQDLLALWQDTGLLDEAGAERPAYRLWNEWMRRPRR